MSIPVGFMLLLGLSIGIHFISASLPVPPLSWLRGVNLSSVQIRSVENLGRESNVNGCSTRVSLGFRGFKANAFIFTDDYDCIGLNINLDQDLEEGSDIVYLLAEPWECPYPYFYKLTPQRWTPFSWELAHTTVATTTTTSVSTTTATTTTTTTTTTTKECRISREQIQDVTSSTVYNNNKKSFGPLLAIDGKLNKDGKHSGFFHTKKEKQPWFQMEFNNDIEVSEIKITNRIVNNMNRLAYKIERFRDVMVTVGYKPMSKKSKTSENKFCGFYEGPAKKCGGVESIRCEKPVKGKYLVVQLEGEEYFNFNEIEVHYIC